VKPLPSQAECDKHRHTILSELWQELIVILEILEKDGLLSEASISDLETKCYTWKKNTWITLELILLLHIFI